MVEDRGAAEDTAEHAASFSLVARILYSFIQYYGLFFIELSLHGGASFSSVAFPLCISHPAFDVSLLSTFIPPNKLNLVAEECIQMGRRSRRPWL